MRCFHRAFILRVRAPVLHSIAPQQVEKMMQMADLNCDGVLDFDEFVRMARLGALRRSVQTLNAQQSANLQEALSEDAKSYAVRLQASVDTKGKPTMAWADPSVLLHLAEMRGAEKGRRAGAHDRDSMPTWRRTGQQSGKKRECLTCSRRDCCCCGVCGFTVEAGRVLNAVWLQISSPSPTLTSQSSAVVQNQGGVV